MAVKTEKRFAVFDSEYIIGKFKNLRDLIKKWCKNTVKIIAVKITWLSEIFFQGKIPCSRKRHSLSQTVSQEAAVCVRFFCEDFGKIVHGRDFSGLASKTERIDHMQCIKHRDPAHGKTFRTGGAYRYRKLENEICTTAKCHLRPLMFGKESRSTALDEITAHGDDHVV